MNNIFKKGFYILAALVLGFATSCDDDDVEITKISGLDFVIATLNLEGTEIGVVPTTVNSNNRIVYSVDFGATPDVDTDNIATSGPMVTFEYPNVDGTYSITVTASLQGASDVSITKEITITEYIPPVVDGPSNSPTPITFEPIYSFRSFDGGDISTVTNPDQNGNTSNNVAQLVKNAGEPWGGSVISVPEPFSFADGTIVTMKVWSPRVGLNLLLKIEDNSNPINDTGDIIATSTVANTWEELSWDVSGIDTSLDFANLVFIIDNGTIGDGSADFTVYIDDISLESYFDFEPQESFRSFDGGDISVVANPDQNGNTSSNVAQLVKNAGEPWGGSVISVQEPLSFAEGTTVTMKVWSPRVGLNLLLKIEDNSNPINDTGDIIATSTVANMCEELTWDVSGIDTSLEWKNLVFIIDNGTIGDGSADFTVYIDDIDIN